MKALYVVAMILLIVGGLSWGLIAAFDFDFVASFFGAASTTSRVIYGLVGLSALYKLFITKSLCCKTKCQ